jgi:hypothetical protein
MKIIARFDIEKLKSSSYGKKAWKVVWGTIQLEDLAGADLCEGDSAATLKGRENVYCIAFECPNSPMVELVRSRLSASSDFRLVSAQPEFVVGRECDAQPLVPAGYITKRGLFNVEAWNPRNALTELRGVEQPSSLSPGWMERLPFTDYETPERPQSENPIAEARRMIDSIASSGKPWWKFW